MKKNLFLGIDTSNYMTSICLIDEERKIILENKKLLAVEIGEKGLQQSNAVFQHIQNIPDLLQDFKEFQTEFNLNAIGVSRAPRPIENSYMPVFQVGIAIAESLSAILSVPIYYTTHQEGHIAAGIYSSLERPNSNHFLGVHLSGGTSEILNVEVSSNGYNIEILGGTLDLHAGQLVDRMGVLMGEPFPAGKYLEEIAKKSSNDFKRFPTSVKNYSFHFSGAEAEAKRRLEKKENFPEIARAIEHHIASSISKALINAIEDRYPKEILIVGGVAQNQYIRQELIKRLEHKKIDAKLYFADKYYSGDNAFGVANLALNQYRNSFNSFSN